MASSGVRWTPPVPVRLPGRVRTSSTHAQRCAGVDLRILPRHFRWHGSRRHSYSRRPRTIGPMSLDRRRLGTKAGRASCASLVAGTSRGDFVDASFMRTEAQSRAEIESPRVRVPYSAGCELLVTTALRTAAHAQYRRRYQSAFGHRPPRFGARLPYVVDKVPGPKHPLTRRPWHTAHRTVHRGHVGRFGRLHHGLNLEACRWVSRPPDQSARTSGCRPISSRPSSSLVHSTG